MKRSGISLASISVKIPLMILFVVIVMVSLSILFTSYLSFDHFKHRLEEESKVILTTLESVLSSLLREGAMEEIRSLIESTGALSSLETIRLYDSSYKIIASNNSDEAGGVKEEEIVKEIIEEGSPGVKNIDYRKNIYVFSQPIKTESDVDAVLFLSMDLYHERKFLSSFRSSVILEHLILFLVLAIILIMYNHRVVSVPLRVLMKATDEISRGNYQFRVKMTRTDEFGKFSNLFNRMLEEITEKNHKLKNYSQQLVKEVNERTRSLEEAKERLEEAYEELKAQQEQLLLSQKMEAVGKLAGGIAHDFNNMLTVIMGHSEVLLLSLTDGSLKSSVEEILNAAKRASSLTRQLLAFSRRQILQPKILNLNELIREMEKMLKHLIREDIELEIIFDPELGNIKVDEGQIQQVILNLVVNAKDAISEKGKITVKTQNIYLDEEFSYTHYNAVPGNYVLLTVRDTGTGMDRDTLSHIFEPFFTTKELGKGTGLGLATVYGIVKQSNGYIFCESEPGKGTAFKIYLPIIYEDIEKGEKLGEPSKSLRGTETVLVKKVREVLDGV